MAKVTSRRNKKRHKTNRVVFNKFNNRRNLSEIKKFDFSENQNAILGPQW